MRPCDNPFATDRIERLVRYRFRDGAWADFEARLAALGWRGAIVGPKGTGKTTLIEDLAPRLEQRGWRVHYLRLCVEQPRLPRGYPAPAPPFTEQDAVLCDGAEQLSWWDWRRFLRATRPAAAVIITTHRPGRLPTAHECRPDAALLATLQAELTAHLDAPLVVDATQLLARHHGNLREALRELYDHYAAR